MLEKMIRRGRKLRLALTGAAGICNIHFAKKPIHSPPPPKSFPHLWDLDAVFLKWKLIGPRPKDSRVRIRFEDWKRNRFQCRRTLDVAEQIFWTYTAELVNRPEVVSSGRWIIPAINRVQTYPSKYGLERRLTRPEAEHLELLLEYLFTNTQQKRVGNVR